MDFEADADGVKTVEVMIDYYDLRDVLLCSACDVAAAVEYDKAGAVFVAMVPENNFPH